MTAADLLEELLYLKEIRDIDLSKVDIVVEYTHTEASIPYDIGEKREIYPDEIKYNSLLKTLTLVSI